MEIEVRGVSGDESSAGSGNDAVDEEFCEDEVRVWRGSWTLVWDAIASDGKANAVCFVFEGRDSGDDMFVCDGFGVRDGGGGDEGDGICASGGMTGTALS